MPLPRWFVCATFAGVIIAQSFQQSELAHASSAPTFLIADPSAGSSQGGQGKTESGGKMQSDKDPLSGEGASNPNSRLNGHSNQASGGSKGKQHFRSGKVESSDAKSPHGKLKDNDPANDIDPTSKEDVKPLR